MDFGFGAFLEKFEDHFGRAATKFLLALLGLAAVALAGSVVWNYLLEPMVAFLAEFIPGRETPRAEQFGRFFIFLMLAMFGLNWSLDLANHYLKARLNQRLLERTREARQLLAEMQETRRLIGLDVEEAGDHLVAARLCLDETVQSSLDKGLITAEQADELRGIAKRTPEVRSADPPECAKDEE